MMWRDKYSILQGLIMNKTENKKKWDLIKEKKSDILGITSFFAALTFLILIGSLGFYW